ALWVEAVVEYDGKEARSDKSHTLYFVKHKWGQTWLPIPLPLPGNPTVKYRKEGPISYFLTPAYRVIHIQTPTQAQKYEAKAKELTRSKQDTNATAVLDLAQWCLSHGLIQEIPKLMDKAAKADPKHPSVIAFKKMEAEMNRDPKPGDPAEVWKERFSI